MDDEESSVNMEAIGKKPVKRTKGGAKMKNKVTMPQLQDEIRASRKEVPKSEVGLRVQLISSDNDVCYVPGHLAHTFSFFLDRYVLIRSHDLDSHDRLLVQQNHLVGNSIVPSFCTFSIVLSLW